MLAEQLILHVIRPALQWIDLHSPEAEQLLIGTAAQESMCGFYLHQVSGPAIGIFQMEPATYLDIWHNVLDYHAALAMKVQKLGGKRWDHPPPPEEMHGNLFFAAVMTRLQYYRWPEAIPTDLHGQAVMWKRRYNTERGAGTIAEYKANFRKYVGD